MYKTITTEVPDMQAEDKKLGVRLEIYTDFNSESPREWDQIGTLVSWHRDLASDKKYNIRADLDHVLCAILKNELGEEHYPYEEDRTDLLNRIVKSDKLVVMPLYVFSHGGIRLSTSTDEFASWDPTGFDYGLGGIYFTTKERIRKEFDVKRITAEILEKAKQAMKSELEVYNQWENNEVYRYEVTDLEGNHLDSCGGFLGDDWKEQMADIFENEAWKPLLDKLESCS